MPWSVKPVKRLLTLSLTALLLASCQAPLQYLSADPNNSYLRGLSRTQAPQPQVLLTAKDAFTQAEFQAQKWSQDAALSHVLGQHITSQGLPHARYGSWTFSFINYVQPEQGFQVILRAGKPPQTRLVAAQNLPFSEPLEDRAWEIDSNSLIPELRKLIPGLTLPLTEIELTAVDHRLVWSLGPKYRLDAMTGLPFKH